MIPVSACLWALPWSAEAALDHVSTAGFRHADLRPDCWAGIGVEDLRDRSLSVGCAGLGPMTMAPGVSLEALAGPDPGRVLPYIAGAIERAARLGAAQAYIVTPGARLDDHTVYVRSMLRLADIAAGHGVRLCVEPHPGRALSTAAEALEFVRSADHQNLYVLLDLGHCLITGEDPTAAAAAAGDRLGYVHIDDNDAKSDLHWPLFTGVLRSADVDGLMDQLASMGYNRGIGIELSRQLAGPLSALVVAAEYLERWAQRRGVSWQARE